MKLSGLHFLLTYRCTYACDHCFVWGSPAQTGVLTIEQIRQVLRQGREIRSLKWIYFEGGEPFLYYPVMVRAVQMASAMGFHVGLVTNGYWATTAEDAEVWLNPFVDLVEDLSISSDHYHHPDGKDEETRTALAAARGLGIPAQILSVARPGSAPGGEESTLMYRGRAARQLAPSAAQYPWRSFTQCAYESLDNPGRVHVDPLGNVHVCQGLVIGNVFERTLKQIWSDYEPAGHPVIGPLLSGGPAGLVARYDLPHAETYADACHLCYEARLALRLRFGHILKPDQMYGVGQ